MKLSAWLLPLALLQSTPYKDPRFNFTLEPPAFQVGAEDSVTPVMFFAPPEDGFASNLNVQVQATPMSLKEYGDLSRGQFKQMNLKVLAEKELKVSGRDAVFWEYAGKMQGRELRFLSLAVQDKGRVYLLTATASEDGFKKHEKALRASIDSFKLP